jgi:hypothetical protein
MDRAMEYSDILKNKKKRQDAIALYQASFLSSPYSSTSGSSSSTQHNTAATSNDTSSNANDTNNHSTASTTSANATTTTRSSSSTSQSSPTQTSSASASSIYDIPASQKYQYLYHELLHIYFTAPSHNTVFTLSPSSSTILFICIWVRLFIHYAAQYVYLNGISNGTKIIQSISIHAYIVYLNYTDYSDSPVITPFTTSIFLHVENYIYLITIGPCSCLIVFILLSLFTSIFQMILKYNNFQYWNTLLLSYGIATILDPLCILIVDLCTQNFQRGDSFLLWQYYSTVNNTSMIVIGSILTAMIYICYMCIATVCLYLHVMYIHNNFAIYDHIQRLYSSESMLYLPNDYEISIEDLYTIVQQCKEYTGANGMTRKIKLSNIQVPKVGRNQHNNDTHNSDCIHSGTARRQSIMQSIGIAITINDSDHDHEKDSKDTVTQITVYDVETNGDSTQHRMFLVLADGSIYEIFDVIPYLSKAMDPSGQIHSTIQQHVFPHMSMNNGNKVNDNDSNANALNTMSNHPNGKVERGQLRPRQPFHMNNNVSGVDSLRNISSTSKDTDLLKSQRSQLNRAQGRLSIMIPQMASPKIEAITLDDLLKD